MSRSIGIVLAAGVGSRMGGDKKKQFMEINSKPLMCYSIEVMEKSPVIDEIIVVTGSDDVDYVKNDILGKHDYHKVTKVISGGSQRCMSVWEGIRACEAYGEDTYIFIHDAARPFLDEGILKRNLEAVKRTGGCVTAIPSQDTIRLMENGYAGTTIPRDNVWMMQTPQTFRLDVAHNAFKSLLGKSQEELKAVTDDVMVVQAYNPDIKIEMVEGSRINMKITTEADLLLADAIIETL